MDYTSFTLREEVRTTETKQEELSMTYDDSLHLKNLAAVHHYVAESLDDGVFHESEGSTICQLGWYNNNLYDITGSKVENVTMYKHIHDIYTTKVSHNFTYDEQSTAGYLNKYETYNFSTSLFLYNIELEYLRPFAFLGLLGKGPKTLPKICSLFSGKQYGTESRPSYWGDQFEETYQFDSDGRLTNQRYGNATYEY